MFPRTCVLRRSKKGRQHKGQKKKNKRTNNDLQNAQINIKIEKHESHSKPGVNSGALVEQAVLAPLVAVLLTFLKIIFESYVRSQKHD
jgi:hypothetical protein